MSRDVVWSLRDEFALQGRRIANAAIHIPVVDITGAATVVPGLFDRCDMRQECQCSTLLAETTGIQFFVFGTGGNPNTAGTCAVASRYMCHAL